MSDEEHGVSDSRAVPWRSCTAQPQDLAHGGRAIVPRRLRMAQPQGCTASLAPRMRANFVHVRTGCARAFLHGTALFSHTGVSIMLARVVRRCFCMAQRVDSSCAVPFAA